MGKKYLHQNFNLKVKHFKTSKKRKENKISIKFINANYLIKNIKKKKLLKSPLKETTA